MAIAGYRLAALLEQILPASYVPPVNSTRLSPDELADEVRALLAKLQSTRDTESAEKLRFSTVEIALG
jgi:hypothetical protein